MTHECPVCGQQPEEKIIESRDKFADPSRTELELHIKRNHNMEELRKHLSKGKKSEVESGLQFADVDKVVAQCIDGAKEEDKPSKTKKSGAGRPAKSSKRGASVKESKPTVRVSNTDVVDATLEAKGLPKTSVFK
jgi:hypothetical protein